MGYMFEGEDISQFIEVRDGRETFVVTPENISKVRVVPTDIILPDDWKGKAFYRLRMDFEILGTLIPKHYTSDGASVPRLFWSFYPPVGRYLLAALLHDWKLDQRHGWEDSNHAFDEAMRHIGIIPRRHWVIMRSVQLNGWIQSTFFGDPK